MKKSQILLLLFILSLFSCQKNKDAEFRKQIIGEWKFIEKVDSTQRDPENIPPEPPGMTYKLLGYQFYENGDCEDKLGYISIDDSHGYDNRKINYLGNDTKYKIDKGSLKIFNLETKKWVNQKIISIVKDTLILQVKDSMYNKYAKTNYLIDTNEQYDKIIVSSSGCYGACPVDNICVNKNGNVLYQGLNFTTNNGLFSSKISEREYLQIEHRFKKASITKLNTHYAASHTDDQTISVTFIRNNKIYKTILDYGSESPAEFQWAYLPVRFLDQKLKLQPHKGNAANISNRIFDFETVTEICPLTQSESFFLLTELDKGKETTTKFTPKYTSEYWHDEKKITIYTDGRYFSFPTKNGAKTIDLGYDFLERNNFHKKFKKKTK